ncbi:MAG: FRG domain-containing protein [Candidatus Desantisbacteria bacterium]
MSWLQFWGNIEDNIMPNTLTEKSITNLSEFTAFIEDNINNVLWYRGCNSSKNNLIPSLYRHKKHNTINQFLDVESKIMNKFKERSTPFLESPLSNDIENLFLMQHFGVPTRLLDWTENPFIAMYFALTLIKSNSNTTEDAIIWILNPINWNQNVLSHRSYKGGVISIYDIEIAGYKPTEVSNSEPIAIYGKYNNRRIVAQRGVFTLFGTSTQPMEEIYKLGNFPPDCIIKLIVPSNKIDDMLKSIIRIGFSDSVVFPDLDGLSKEIKRIFEYEV